MALALPNSLHHGLRAAALRAEIDLDGRQGLGLLALWGILRPTGGDEEEEDQGEGEEAFHGRWHS